MRPAGLPKTGGRTKGSVNHRTKELLTITEELGVHPFEVLLHFVKGDWRSLGYKSGTRQILTKTGDIVEIDVIEPETHLKAASEACQYLYPKRKAVELSGEEGKPLSFTDLISKANQRHC